MAKELLTTEPVDLTTRELEEAVLCTLLSSPEHMPEVAVWLKPEMFDHPDLELIWSAMLTQYNRGITPDLLTTDIEMRRRDRKRFEETGGVAALSGSISTIRMVVNLVNYAEEIKRQYLLRTFAKTFTAFTAKASLIETDPLDLFILAENTLLALRDVLQSDKPIVKLSGHAAEALETHKKRMKGEIPPGLLTGLTELDEIFGGLQPGELYVEGGRPGDGKTATALDIAMRSAMAGNNTCVFSMEMTRQQLLNRLFAGYADINPYMLRLSKFTDRELLLMDNLVRQWEELPLYIDFTPANSVTNIRAQVLLMSKRTPIQLVIVDYLHLLEGKPGRGETLEQVIARNVRALKRLALEAECPVLVLSQMNRQSENRPEKGFRPNLSDLRDSGSIEQDADGVFFVYRPERHGITQDPDTGESLRGICQLIVRKNRNGITGTAQIRHNQSFTRFTNVNQ